MGQEDDDNTTDTCLLSNLYTHYGSWCFMPLTQSQSGLLTIYAHCAINIHTQILRVHIYTQMVFTFFFVSFSSFSNLLFLSFSCSTSFFPLWLGVLASIVFILHIFPSLGRAIQNEHTASQRGSQSQTFKAQLQQTQLYTYIPTHSESGREKKLKR